jgi:hypothetical protein
VDEMAAEDDIPNTGAQEISEDIHGNNGKDSTLDVPYANLHPNNPGNFFKLTCFLKITLARSITNLEIDEAEQLIRSYCTEILHVRRLYSNPNT